MTTDAHNARLKIKNQVTPYAFGVADELLGIPLAKPFSRLMAILIDLSIVALLASLNWVLLAVVLLCTSSVALVRWQKTPDRRGAKLLLASVAVISAILLGVQISLFIRASEVQSIAQVAGVNLSLSDEDQEQEIVYEFDSISPSLSLNLSSIRDSDGDLVCSVTNKCGEQFFDAFLDHLIETGYSHDESELTLADVAQWLEAKHLLDDDALDASFSERLYRLNHLAFENAEDSEEAAPPGIVSWARGLLNDLGLSFGWSAVYFSVLTAWWNGQTVGKRLVGLRVVGIDGKPLDLWASFGRYGGYGAGIATGLLGFAQIYWDDNRQAIQDKISETLVIKSR